MSKSIIFLLVCSFMIQVIMAHPETSAARQFTDVLPINTYGEGCDLVMEHMSLSIDYLLVQAEVIGSQLLEMLQDIMVCDSGIGGIIKCIGKAFMIPVYAAALSLGLLWEGLKFSVTFSYTYLIHCIFGLDFLSAVAQIA